MGKQTVLASLVNVSAVAVGSSERTILQSVGWIDASSVYGSAMKFELFMNTVTQAHTGTRTALPLFDAINNIHTNNTKRTTIEIKFQNMIANTGQIVQGVTTSTPANSYILIEIDWEALRVKWSGALFTGSGVGNACFQGNEPIDALGSAIEMQSWSPDAGRGNPIGYTPFVYLETGPGRKLVKLPLFSLGLSVGFFPAAGRNIASYAITTDDGITVTAAPEPPAADVVTVTQEVSGIKISELNAADSLNDTDLFVLSRDDPAGGPYDESRNITKADLFQEIVTQISAPVFLETTVPLASGASLSLTTYDLTTVLYGNIPAGAKFAILECYWTLSGPDGVGVYYVYMSGGETLSPASYILAAMRSSGSGDAVAGANQAMCPIEDNKICLSAPSAITGTFYVKLIGYFS